MFIELTDHLRCAAVHPESYLILLPASMDGRLVKEGVLGCPVCGREVAVREGIADFGGGQPGRLGCGLSAEAAQALLGISGPGGYVALAGGATALAEGLGGLLPGVRFVVVNPPAAMEDAPLTSVLRGARLPIKRASMRGAVVTADHAADPAWLADLVGCVLPGLRVVVEGPVPDLPGVEVLAEAGGWWVGRG